MPVNTSPKWIYQYKSSPFHIFLLDPPNHDAHPVGGAAAPRLVLLLHVGHELVGHCVLVHHGDPGLGEAVQHHPVDLHGHLVLCGQT